MFLVLASLLTLLSKSESKINLYISNTELQRILGFDAEFYYIRDGVESWNAMKWPLLISENIEYLSFRWHDASNSDSISVSSRIWSENEDIVPTPILGILSESKIPVMEEEFQVYLKCNDKLDGSTFVHFEMNVTGIPSHQLLGPKASVNYRLTFNKLCKFVKIENPEEDINDYPDMKYIPPDEGNSPSDGTKTKFFITFGVGFFTFLFLTSAIGYLHMRSKPKAKDDESVGLASNLEAKEEEIVPKIVPKGLKVAIAEERQKELILLLKDFLIRRNRLSIGNTVQEGSFGRAYMGTLINPESGEEMKVLMKTVTDQAEAEQKTLFIKESTHLKKLTHHNVLSLMHVCFDEGKPPLIIYQYMNRGNLKNYLRLSRTAEPLLKSLTTRDIVLMATQIARGLQYLHRRHIIHKDVATRNCVVDEELHVKVCDNGLARDFFPGDYHSIGDNENKPIRWMASECLENGIVQPLSDVWSYGVLLWELCSLAQTPYANVDPFEMLTYLKSGLRLPQPVNCPDDFFTVMACCWALAPEERPHFPQIIACLDAFIAKLNAYI